MDSKTTNTQPVATLSIVSHGHGQMIDQLLGDISQSIDIPCEIVLTINTPEDENYLTKFKELNIRVIRNHKPKGFGENHNIAFNQSHAPYFVIINPDIRANPFKLEPLIDALTEPFVGAAGPMIVDNSGRIQDSARKFPTIWNMIKRKYESPRLDYSPSKENIEVDWVAGMLVAFTRKSYESLGGFDTGYFMYVEDADICWKLRQSGKKILLVGKTSFTHEAQRASHRSMSHLFWHLQSLIRFNLKLLGVLS